MVLGLRVLVVILVLVSNFLGTSGAFAGVDENLPLPVSNPIGGPPPGRITLTPLPMLVTFGLVPF